MFICTPKEIAWCEYLYAKVSNQVISMLQALRPSIAELELSAMPGVGYWPTSVHPVVIFGSENLSLSPKSPGLRRLKLGEPIGIGPCIRGSLVARFGVAVYDLASYMPELKDSLESFYMPYFKAVCTWYENIKIDADCGEIYNKVMAIVGDKEKFDVAFNPGHNIGEDEWTNTPFEKGSRAKLQSGYYIQSDIIASTSNPVKIAICEDGVILADKKLQSDLKKQYPALAARLEKRSEYMREVVSVNISDDVLLLSNLSCKYFPFMLDTSRIFSLK